MHKYNMLKKSLVCAILVLFLGMCVMPITGSLSIERVSTENQTRKSNFRGDNDTTPPVTTIYFDPPYPDGLNDWYVSDVTITLEATDDMSGVDVIKYLLDDSDWLTCTGPFTVESDGCHRITYYAIDKAGNVEQPSEVIRFGIDQTPPTIELTWEVSGNFITGWEIIFTATCNDATSGMDRVEFYINDVLAFTDDTPPYEWLLIYQGWPYTYKSTAFDMAGNSAFAIVNDSDIDSYSNSQSSSTQQSSSSSSSRSSKSVVPSTGTTVVKKPTIPTFYDGNTLYVGGSGPDNYSSIQAAVNDANNGDTVFVYSGMYNETVEIKKQIDLVGENAETTIIDGSKYPDKVGVVWLRGNGVKVTGFTIQNGGYEAGVNVWSENNIITGNIITNKKKDGIRLYGSHNTVSDNIIKNNKKYGINLYDSSYDTIVNNIFELQDGIYITCSWEDPYEAWCTHYIEDNMAHGRPIRYYKNKNNVVIPSDTSQVILANCYNFVLQNLNLSGMDVGALIGCYSSGNQILDNTIMDNSNYGISIEGYETNSNVIADNTITNNGAGVILVDSHDNEVYGNNIVDNTCGISATASLWPTCGNSRDAYNNNIYDNDIFENKYGIYLGQSGANNVFGNNIKNNKNGVFIEGYHWGSCDNKIYENNITNNEEGIYIYGLFGGACDNKIYHNNFIGNIQNAYDEGRNKWDNGSAGNYWDDYNGIDILPPYGIGDTPYNIPPRSLINRDRHPLMGPWPDIRSHSRSQSSQQSTNPLLLRFLEIFMDRFPLLQRLLSVLGWYAG